MSSYCIVPRFDKSEDQQHLRAEHDKNARHPIICPSFWPELPTVGITRDDVLNDRIRQRLKGEIEQGHAHTMLSDEEFSQTRANVLAEFEAHDELWVFGYGSLIWSPTFEFVQSAVALLSGHGRKFCLWAPTGRGSREHPGLWLALDDALNESSCTGVAFRIDNAVRDYETLMLWRREMVSGAYLARVRNVTIDGEEKPCICLLANKNHERYAGHLPEARMVQAIATAEGQLGTCREYLFNLEAKLTSLTVHDEELRALAAAVRDHRRALDLPPE